MAPATTRDAFLGGRLWLEQPAKGYRAGIDPVLLAAAVPARAGERVLELGVGAGAAILCLGRRVPGLTLVGIERQAVYAALARRNAAAAKLQLEVIEGDVAAPPPALTAQVFDHALINPPFFPAGSGTAACDPGRADARAEAVPLQVWIACAARRLRPGGRLTVIQRAERMPELLAAASGRFGGMSVLPIAPRLGRPARLILFRGLKDRRTPLALLPPLILHDGPEHLSDGDDYSAEATAVLRDMARLVAL